MTILVWAHKLLESAEGWGQQADGLYGAGKSLSAAQDDVALLGSRVAPAAASFLSHWGDTLEALRKEADQHDASLTRTAQELEAADKDTVEGMQRLLSWGDRDATPAAPGGPR